LIRRIIEALDSKRSDLRDDWIRVLFFLKTLGEDYKDLANSFSRKCVTKYNENAFEKEWSSLKPDPSRENQLSIGTLYYWMQRDHMERICDTKERLSTPMLTGSTMSINSWIEKYDGQPLDLVKWCEIEWDLMCVAARITKTNEYVVRNGCNDFSTVTFNEMEQKLKGCSVVKQLNQISKGKQISMIEVAQTFKKSILYSKSIFRPSLGHERETESSDRIYNTFTGFAYQRIQEANMNLLGPNSDDRTLLGFIYQILCNSEDLYYEWWFLDWLAFTLQYPCELIGDAPCFISEEGAGKRTFFDFFGNKIIGARYFTTKGIDGLLGNLMTPFLRNT
jgi:hypothetical protein